MELIARIIKTDPQLAEDLMRLLNEMELARHERQTPQRQPCPNSQEFN